jgi:integrase
MEMATKTNLLQRNGRWYFNKAYPKRLWPVTGKAPFRRTLETDSLQVAQQRRPEADQEYWATVRAAEQKLLEPEAASSANAKHLTEVGAIELFTRWYHEALLAIKEQWPDKLNRHELATREEAVRSQIAEAREELATGDFWHRKAIARRLMTASGFKSADKDALLNLQRLLSRGSIELDRQQLSWLGGDYSYHPADPVVAQAASADLSSVARQKTIGDLIDAYRDSEEHKWSPSTQSSYKPIWRLLEDVLGRDKALAEIDRAAGRKLFDLVQRLPKNLGKKKELQGLTIPEAIEKAQQLSLETIAPKTINGTYMGCLSTIFKWGVKEQWMEFNPVRELNVRDNVAPADKRDPFTPEQLKALFALPPWKTKDFATNPLHYWGPLLALFLGMRRGEIAQLAVSDLMVSEGILVIHVRDDGGGKRVKTSAGRRILPIHDELLRLGFAEYVSAREKSGEERLFEGEAPNSRGQWGNNLTRWFTGLLKTNGIEGRKLGLHSFRHNFEDRLRAAELHGTDIGRELAGRSKGKDAASSYGSGYSIYQLKKAVDKIDYRSFNLPL